jgi:hypothetical protein
VDLRLWRASAERLRVSSVCNGLAVDKILSNNFQIFYKTLNSGNYSVLFVLTYIVLISM